ncbi:MAG TPA: LysM peptidoglycan-binding domain-containing protein [Lacunisphaera sp.]|nr:LysM peptidoglycan-binding domain-containing protein [Lacunisphaera sp.]
MKILKIFGVVVTMHLLAFIFIFASPGCSSGPRNQPTPDATVPAGAQASAPTSFAGPEASPQPIDLGTPVATYTPPMPAGHAAPTRPGSAAAVVVTPAKPVENVAPVSTYTVGSGDSLWSIAKKNGMTVAELAKANSIPTNTVLKPGRKLIIPGKVGAPAKEAAATAPANMSLPAEKNAMPVRPAGEKYTVQVGESLGVIARKFQLTVGELARENHITDPSKVRAGQVLSIPGGSTVKVKTPAATASAVPTAKPAETPPTQPPADKPAGPHFDISPPPPGQDLDSGLKSTEATVPVIKVEDATTPPAKN